MIMCLWWIFVIYWLAIQPKQMLVQTTLYVQFFHVKSVLQPYLTIFNNNSGGSSICLFVYQQLHLLSHFERHYSLFDWQPHFKGSSALSPLYSCTWWYIWSGSKSFNLKWVLSLSCHFVIIFISTKIIKSFLPLAT